MSHLKLIIDYRGLMGEKGITCLQNQAKACNEAFTRALLKYQFRFNDNLNFNETTEEKIWKQLDLWNSVSPINARFILESAKARMNQVRKDLLEHGTVCSSDLFSVVFDVTQMTDQGETQSRWDATDCEVFQALVNFLYNELVSGRE